MGSVGLHRRGEVTLEELVEEIKKNPEIKHAGAIACFMGIVRMDGSELDDVQCLEYESYEEVALQKLNEIREDILSRPGVIDVSLHHVVDRLRVSEESLYVAVAGRHRKEAFPAIIEAVERVKREVPIWKKEVSREKSAWIATEPH